MNGNGMRMWYVALLALLFLASGCAAWTAENYGSHKRLDFVVNDNEIHSKSSIEMESPVKEVSVVAGLCESRDRKTPRAKGRKYIPVGSNPVNPGRYYDPTKEFLFYFPKDMLLGVEYGKEKKISRVWIEEGTVGVADKVTGRALRVCKCGNGIRDVIFVRKSKN